MIELLTQPNENQDVSKVEVHILNLPSGLCPVSKNPRHESTIKIVYRPKSFVLEIGRLYAYLYKNAERRASMDNIPTRVEKLEKTQIAAIHTMDIRFAAVDARLAAVENRLTSIERLLVSLNESNQLIAQMINERLPPASKEE